MADISWSENAPADGDSAGLGAAEFRSLKTALRTAVNEEHVFPTSSGPAGIHKLGSGRPYVGLQSAVSSSGTDGRLFHASDTSQLFGVGSGGTVFLGGPTVISAGSYPGAVPQRHQWVMEFGTGQTGSNGSVTISIPNSGYSGLPVVVVSDVRTPSTIVGTILQVAVKTPTDFRVGSFTTAGLGVGLRTFDWMSMGSRVL